VKNGEMLRIGARHAIDRAEFADAVSGAKRADASDTGIAVGGLRGVELVAATDPADVGIVHDRVVDGESVIARHSEDVGDADLMQTGENMLNDSGRHRILQCLE
jgi:hypothetical protein